MKHSLILIGTLLGISFTANSLAACKTDLPYEQLMDCIVVEGSGSSYKASRDHIPTASSQKAANAELGTTGQANNKVSKTSVTGQ